MKPLSIAAMTFLLTSVAGCSLVSHEDEHPSQGVYQVELASAKHFMQQANKLESEMLTFCEEGDLQQVQQQWQQTMLSWMALQGQERGPESALEKSWNIQFWPDKKNTTGRKMAALVNSDKHWNQDDIAQQSVTVQGLGSIEWLLYDQDSPLKSSTKHCHVATAIASNLASNAALIASAWEENPWSGLDEKAWTSEYISLLSNQLEYSMKKMTRPLAKFGKPRPYFAESWRSGTSMKNLKANITAMQTLYLSDGNGLDHTLRQNGHIQLADSITRQFSSTLETWPVDESLFELLQTKEGYRVAYAQYNKLEQLKYLIHEEVAIKLGVVIGFNATDGD
ncbi:iron-regulated protein A [Vibrio sp. OCN044]|uniref:Iron-regulated protein A n=1 Tax=Vibrio tetraodonis subsp. pristinus TaxID=2695891 RepID=A0A6L8LQK4_9VIBR|nr:iron-regulated protein A [Vibrio tetraodonis subsp. pristinus]